jgi:hypothetical protein
MRKHLAAVVSHKIAGAATPVSAEADRSVAVVNSERKVFSEIGLILFSTLGFVTLVQLALVAFHVA